MGDRRGLNPRHSESQSDALPTELRPPNFIVGSWRAPRMEALPTVTQGFASQTRRVSVFGATTTEFSFSDAETLCVSASLKD